MAVSVILTRSYDRQFHETGQTVTLEEWIEFVKGDPELRLKTDPFTAKNPKTGETITVPAGPGQTEFCAEGSDQPFLRFRDGELVMRLTAEMEKSNNTLRHKVAAVAKQLGLLITHDASDEILDW